MQTILSSQLNRRERIADAMRIEWNGFKGTYTPDLWSSIACEIDMIRNHGQTKGVIYFGGSKHTLTLTQLEDLCELVRRSYHEQQEAKAVR
jgi:coproporphyrinogen III oxidase-like Fe-S oxidoreductase